MVSLQKPDFGRLIGLLEVKMSVYGKLLEAYANRHSRTPNFDFKMRVYGKLNESFVVIFSFLSYNIYNKSGGYIQ